MEPGPSGTSKVSAQISGQSDTDITAEFLQPLLTPDNVANLVRKGEGRSPQGGEEGSVVLLLLPLHTLTSAGGIGPETPSVLVGRVWASGPSDPFSGLYSFRGHWSPPPQLLFRWSEFPCKPLTHTLTPGAGVY